MALLAKEQVKALIVDGNYGVEGPNDFEAQFLRNEFMDFLKKELEFKKCQIIPWLLSLKQNEQIKQQQLAAVKDTDRDEDHKKHKKPWVIRVND